MTELSISILVPTLNERENLPNLQAWQDQANPDVEILICDGGSDDGTIAYAGDVGLTVINCPPGRGQQLAAGVAASSGDVLLFLHADTILQAGSLNAIRHTLNDPQVIGGNFRLLFDGETGFAAWLTGFYAWLRAKGIYYGDSVMFIRRSVLDEIGGMRAISLMEDFDLNRRMEKKGRTVCIDHPPAVTSSRRFENRHPWAIFSQWVWIHALYYARLSPDRLAESYKSHLHHPKA